MARRLRILRGLGGKWAVQSWGRGLRRGSRRSTLASKDRPLGAWRALGARPRLGSADWPGGPPGATPLRGAGGKGPGSRSLTPPPSAAQLLLVGCQVTSCGGPPRALSPAAAARTHRPLPFPGRRPPRLLLLGAAAFSWKTFAKVFMSLRTFFSFYRGSPFVILLYLKSRYSKVLIKSSCVPGSELGQNGGTASRSSTTPVLEAAPDS